ncbi:MAG: glycoside hydrolase family 97 N-terminal domain-containing protein, partial [Actinomycetota bacterium]
MGVIAGVTASLVAGCATVDVADPPDGRSTDEIMAEAFTEPLSDPVETVSPDGDLRLVVGAIAGGIPAYRLEHQVDGVWEPTLGTSLLGLVTDRGSLAVDLELVDAGSSEPWRDEFDLPSGKSRRAVVEGRRRTVRFEPVEPNGLALEIDVVVSDAGAAYRSTVAAGAVDELRDRLAVAESPLDSIRVEWERSSFHFDASAVGWFQRRSPSGPFTPAYESLAGTAREVGRLDSPTDAWNLPALVEDGDRWILLAEAGVVREWPLVRVGDAVLGSGEHVVTFPAADEGLGLGDPRPSGPLPLTSPWRVVVTSGELGDVVGSNLVRHLSPPADDRDWSWVRPGRVSWSWWADQDSPRDAERLIDYVEFSAEMGWEYSLVDANWTDLPDGEIERVID